MAKNRVTVFLEPDLLKRLNLLFPGLTDSQAIEKAVEGFFDTKDYSDWSIRTAVISRAVITMLAESLFPGDVDRQEQFILSHISKADQWVDRKLRSDGKR